MFLYPINKGYREAKTFNFNGNILKAEALHSHSLDNYIILK